MIVYDVLNNDRTWRAKWYTVHEGLYDVQYTWRSKWCTVHDGLNDV